MSEEQKQKLAFSRQLLKYGWAVAISGLMFLQISQDPSSKWVPIINQAIDMLQRHNQPINGK
jgi:hypothetical protein